MDRGIDGLAATHHLKGARGAASEDWLRPRGATWYRPAPRRPGDAGSARERRPEHRLITAGRVADAAVYSPAGRHIGRIAEVAIDDATGEVAFVILAEGGILGFGERLHRLPWSALAYDAGHRGYVLDLAEPADRVTSRSGRVPFQRAADRGGWAAGV